MKFHLEHAPGQNRFTSYGPGYVSVNQVRREASLVVGADCLHFDWPARWEELTAAHFEFLLTLRPEIVILGSGPAQKFPHPALSRALHDARIGLESMATPAACRTYNILVNEGRRVIAAVMMP
jgi:uncharacterized protein